MRLQIDSIAQLFSTVHCKMKLVIRDGRIVEQGGSRRRLTIRRTDHMRGLIDAVPRIGRTKADIKASPQ